MLSHARRAAICAALFSTALYFPRLDAQTAEIVAESAPSQPWAQQISDVPADPAVRFGTLPNGMRYAILRNATPPGQAALRLRIDAGSLMENDDQLGLAHFTEHMAFNGTTNIPENELIHILERHGLAFGADTNAGTGLDQTFYSLNLPRADDETVETALSIMREQVSEALMDPKAIDEERGVIAGEERLHNSPSMRVGRKQLPILAKGQKLANRLPIGDLEIIRTAPRERFVDFYRSYYRPSRATMIAVGDFDVAAMEAKILKAFADWRPTAPDGPEPDLGQVAQRGTETHVIVEPGAGASVSLTWVSAPDLAADTVTRRRSDLVTSLALAVLNRRLSELSRTDNPPFLTANAGKGNAARSLLQASITATYAPGKWKQALEAIDHEQRRAVAFGVTPSELQREITAYRTSYQSAVEGASTRQTNGLVNALLMSVNDREVFTTPQTDLALFEKAVKNLAVADVNAALKTIFVGEGPLALLVSPDPVAGGEAAVADAYRASQQLAVTAPQASPKMAWPYTDFGKAGLVTGRRQLGDLGATVVTFANGTILTVKPTKFESDRITIGVLTGGGERNFRPDTIDPLLTMIGGLNSGGLGKMNVDEISRSLNGRVYGAGLSTLGDRFLLSGGTRGEDLKLEMQYMAAYLTDPAFRPTMFEQMKAGYETGYQSTLATPAGAFEAHTRVLRAGGDQRQAVIAPDMLAGWTMDDKKDALKALLADGPLHITMVGDVSVERAIAVTATTFAALPPRPARLEPKPGATERRFPAATPEPLRFKHKGAAEQALGYVAWPTTDAMLDLREARRIELFAAVLRLRVIEEIREREALAYSPGVSASSSDSYSGFGSIAIQAQTAPDKLPAFFAAVDKIVGEMAAKPPTEDELVRARTPIVERLRRAPSQNGWWFSNLAYLIDRPHYLPQVMSGIADVETVTAADIQAMARKYLRSDTAWKAAVEPETP